MNTGIARINQRGNHSFQYGTYSSTDSTSFHINPLIEYIVSDSQEPRTDNDYIAHPSRPFLFRLPQVEGIEPKILPDLLRGWQKNDIK